MLSTEELLGLLGTRENAERTIEALIEALDHIDGDPEVGPDINDEPQGDNELDDDLSDKEPSLGSLDRKIDQRAWSGGRGGDLEQDGWRRPAAHDVSSTDNAAWWARKTKRELEALVNRGKPQRSHTDGGIDDVIVIRPGVNFFWGGRHA